MRLGPPPEVEEAPGQFWKDFIRDTAPVFRKPTIEQLADLHPAHMAGAARRLTLRGAAAEGDLRRAAAGRDRRGQRRRDSPPLSRADAPWVRIVSCNPLEMTDPDLPPVFSGLPGGDRNGWEAFRARVRRAPTVRCGRTSTSGCRSRARRRWPTSSSSTSRRPEHVPVPGRGRLRTRRSAGRRVAPARLVRSRRRRPVPAARAAQRRRGRADLPVAGLPGIGRRRPDAAAGRGAGRPCRTASSCRRGRSTTSTSWPATCGARSSCPSHRSCRMVDLVITHGGNNTTTECFHHGKPMIAMPVFWDQYDNAQRVDETGFGAAAAHLHLRAPTS